MLDASGITVRNFEASDRDIWRTLWTAFLDFYEIGVDEEVYRATFDRLLTDDPSELRGAVGLHRGKPVGLTHYLFHRYSLKVERVVYLQDLFVDPAARGTGVGRALIEHVYGAADEAGCPTVYWLCQESNVGAQRLYDRMATRTEHFKYLR